MLRRGAMSLMVLVAVAAGASACGGAGGEGVGPRTTSAPAPSAERPLLGAPDPSGPTTRGVYLQDLHGQVESLAAGGHLVAWTVRTPADGTDYGVTSSHPIRWPASTELVVADERGGTPMTIDLGRRWVSGMRMLRGARGPAEPQLAVRSCGSHRRASCRVELLTLTPAAPLKVVARRVGGAEAAAAYAGTLDGGRRLAIATGGTSCRQRLRVGARMLPPLPAHEDGGYPHCVGVVDRLIAGRYAFVWIHRTAPAHHFETHVVYGIDLAGGARAAWHDVQHPFRGSDGSTGIAAGPAVTDRALYWEELDEDGTGYSLEQVALPRDVRHGRDGNTPMTAPPIAPGSRDVCDIAATDDAVYQLANQRCAVWGGDRNAGAIQRVVAPRFHPDDS
jgi:hypothetical protein